MKIVESYLYYLCILFFIIFVLDSTDCQSIDNDCRLTLEVGSEIITNTPNGVKKTTHPSLGATYTIVQSFKQYVSMTICDSDFDRKADIIMMISKGNIYDTLEEQIKQYGIYEVEGNDKGFVYMWKGNKCQLSVAEHDDYHVTMFANSTGLKALADITKR